MTREATSLELNGFSLSQAHLPGRAHPASHVVLQVLQFNTNCPECNAPAQTNMKLVRIFWWAVGLFFDSGMKIIFRLESTPFKGSLCSLPSDEEDVAFDETVHLGLKCSKRIRSWSLVSCVLSNTGEQGSLYLATLPSSGGLSELGCIL